MENFGEDFFGAEELADPYPPTSFGTPILFNAGFDLQEDLNYLAHNPLPSTIYYSTTMDLLSTELSSATTSQNMFQHHIPQSSGDAFPTVILDSAVLPSFQRPESTPQSQYNLPVQNIPSNYDQQNQTTLRKRARKAKTIPAKRWEPYEPRIRQLFVHDGLSVEDLRKTINKEFGLNASKRQYVGHLEKMNLMKNVKQKERNAVVKHILYRAQTGKKTNGVKIRGHKKSADILSRWIKEENLSQSHISTSPPSTLPDCISIHTNSTRRSPIISSSDHSSLLQPSTNLGAPSDVLQRLTQYFQPQHSNISPRDARFLLNDLQTVLTGPHYSCVNQTSPTIGQDIIQLRNFMNLSQNINVAVGGKKQHDNLTTLYQRSNSGLIPRSHRHISSQFPCGRLDISFWDVIEKSRFKVVEEDGESTTTDIAATLSIIPNDTKKSASSLTFSFTPHINPLVKISYQAMKPNDSEVFKIVKFGDVETLIRAIESGSASLTDQDEKGRSLLSYAVAFGTVDMCRFLVDEQADVNRMEPDHNGYIGPVYEHFGELDTDGSDERNQRKARCYSIFLEAGADFSLQGYLGDGIWQSTWMYLVEQCSLASFNLILHLSAPFISPNMHYKSYDGSEISPLTILANCCGYDTGEILAVVDKAISLLKRNVEISCFDANGDTLLHTVLKCKRFHELETLSQARISCGKWRWILSTKAPKDLLMVLITAGADVYATNDAGETPSMVAREFGRQEEWFEALESCGFDPVEIIAPSKPNLEPGESERQKSKLSFEEYCQNRKYDWRYEENLRLEELNRRDEFVHYHHQCSCPSSTVDTEEEGIDDSNDEDMVSEESFCAGDSGDNLYQDHGQMENIGRMATDFDFGSEDIGNILDGQLMETSDDMALGHDYTVAIDGADGEVDFENFNPDDLDLNWAMENSESRFDFERYF